MMPGINDIAEGLARISDATPTLTAERCVNLRHQHAGQCDACAAACPADAIALTPAPQFDSIACLACGACAAACPVDALTGVRSLVEMWSKAQETISDGAAALVCRAAGKGDFAAARVPCAGALPPEFFAALALAGAQQVTIHTAACDACPLQPTLAQARQAISAAQGLLAHVGRGVDVAWTEAPPPAQQRAGVTRRGLFSAALNPSKLRAAPVPDVVDELLAAGIGARRALLINAFRATNVPAGASLPASTNQWAAVRADPAACVGCQMCAQFCPTEALVATEDAAGTVTLWFDTARCAACGLCLRACFKQVLTFEPEVALAAVVTSDYEVIWQGQPLVNPLKSPRAFKAPAR